MNLPLLGRLIILFVIIEYYYQCGELKELSLDSSQKDAIEARRKLKPLIKHLIEKGINKFVDEEYLKNRGSCISQCPSVRV